MTDRETMQQALEAMETNQYTVAELAPHKVVMKFNSVITALRTALEQPEQEAEPKCEHCHGIGKTLVYGIEESWEENCLYCNGTGITPAAQRPWQGLTEFQFAEIYNKWNDTNGSTPWGLNQALEAKLRKLNT